MCLNCSSVLTVVLMTRKITKAEVMYKIESAVCMLYNKYKSCIDEVARIMNCSRIVHISDVDR